jgi:phospholipase/carboxylesterase
MEVIEIETAARPDAAVIWLHGLGADGHDFEPIVPELGLPAQLRLRFVFPHAPVRPVTLNQGMRMRAWYDILQLGGGPEDEAGIRASQKTIEDLIAEERRRGIPASRIVLAGFSQGGAIALQTALRLPEPLAGVMALSTYLPLGAKLEAERSEAARAVLHGARAVRRHHPARARRAVAQGARRPGLPAGVAHLSDAALGLRGRDRGHRPLPAQDSLIISR